MGFLWGVPPREGAFGEAHNPQGLVLPTLQVKAGCGEVFLLMVCLSPGAISTHGCLCLCLRKTEDLGDLHPCSPHERPVWHITEGSLEPGPEDGQGRPPAQSLAQVYMQLHVASSDPLLQVHLHPSGLEDLQSLEAYLA